MCPNCDEACKIVDGFCTTIAPRNFCGFSAVLYGISGSLQLLRHFLGGVRSGEDVRAGLGRGNCFPSPTRVRLQEPSGHAAAWRRAAAAYQGIVIPADRLSSPSNPETSPILSTSKDYRRSRAMRPRLGRTERRGRRLPLDHDALLGAFSNFRNSRSLSRNAANIAGISSATGSFAP